MIALLAKNPADRPPTLTAAVEAMAGERALRLRRRVRRWALAALAVAAVAGGSIVIASAARSEPAPVVACASSAARLAGTWDTVTRDVSRAQFAAYAERPMVAATWNAVDAELTRYTDQWAAQWDASCREDRAHDELLYVQRQTCLDNALLAVHETVTSLPSIDVPNFVLAFTGNWVLPNLEDCANDAALRTQVAVPPPEIRDRVLRLGRETHVARRQARAATTTASSPRGSRASRRSATSWSSCTRPPPTSPRGGAPRTSCRASTPAIPCVARPPSPTRLPPSR